MRVKIPLFWRMFTALLILLIVSFSLWSQGFSLWQQYPRAIALAGQITTAVNLTRSALLFADPQQKEALLAVLNSDERVNVYPREVTDISAPFKPSLFMHWLIEGTQDKLGDSTEFASSVNDEAGLWVSFNLKNTAPGLQSYWLKLDVRRLEVASSNPTRWWLWMGMALGIALIGSVIMTRRLTLPLSALAGRTSTIAQGLPYTPLPDSRIREISQVNAGMNQMVGALSMQEAERTFMLASLSHDLRTPLTRLRLEAEMANLPEAAYASMIQDIEQIDGQLKQLTDFVASNHAKLVLTDITAVIAQSLHKLERDATVHVHADLTNITTLADASLLTRAVENIIENAKRYGRDSLGLLKLNVVLQETPTQITLTIQDNGSGVAAQNLDEMLAPFTRGNAARSNSQGNGLGLAIVKRIVQQHQGTVHLLSSIGAGFCVEITFPKAA